MSIELIGREFLAALNGSAGELDTWLECHNEADVRAAMKFAMTSVSKMHAEQLRRAMLSESKDDEDYRMSGDLLSDVLTYLGIGAKEPEAKQETDGVDPSHQQSQGARA